MEATFEWDSRKDRTNQSRHGVSFATAQAAFFDPNRVIAEDLTHSVAENSTSALVECGGILTVRFTYRGGIIRIFGAGYWRKGKRIYEQTHHLQGRPDQEG